MPHEVLRMAMGVPIVPILLLPFILIFFVIVFPIWGVGVILLGLVLLLMRGLNAAFAASGSQALEPAVHGVHRAFRWVWTFGGFAERFTGPGEEEPHAGKTP